MLSDCARRTELRNAATAAVAAALAACSPTFDWREARPEGSAAVLMFPCRPQHQQRAVTLAGSVVAMRLHACSAGGANFALATLDAADPRRVTPELAALRTQLLANVAAAAAEQQQPLVLAGATPNPESMRLHAVGKRPDGSRVVVDAAFFVRGVTLYQATVLGGDTPRGDAVDTFFGAIRLP